MSRYVSCNTYILLVDLSMNNFLIYLLCNHIFGMTEVMHNYFRFLTLQSASPLINMFSRKKIIRLFNEASLCTNVFIP